MSQYCDCFSMLRSLASRLVSGKPNAFIMKRSTFVNCIGSFVVVVFFVNVISGAEISIQGVVNPVKEDGLLSIACTVTGLEDNSQFTIFRTLGDNKIELLASNGDILPSTDDNVFLATRHMQDGSVIYFLTIIQVTKADEGEYSCKISTIREGKLIALKSTPITVNHFPDEGSPKCSPNDLPTHKVGDIMILNCTSNPGSPAVDIQWTKSDTDVLYSVLKNTSDGQLLSELRYRVSMRDHNSVFICTISNPVFPDKTQTCHVGPLIVEPNGDHSSEDGGGDGGVIIPSADPAIVPQDTKTIISVLNKDTKNQCAEFCTEYSQTPFQWKVATLVAVATAVIFLVCGVLLFVMLKTMDKSNNNDLYATGATLQREQLYTELNQKFDDKVYIALQRQTLKEPPMRAEGQPSDQLRIVRKY